MTDPTQSDDDWAELARELERDSPPPLPATESLAEDAETGDDFEDAEGGEGEAAPGEGETEPGDGQPGTGRKRRRRRRRRRKGGPGQPAEAAEATETDAAGPEATTAEASEEEADEREPVAVEEEVGYGESDSGDDEEAEDAGGELLRELTANWNVPSWDEIVSGLYRPER